MALLLINQQNESDNIYTIDSVTTTLPTFFGVIESECNQWLGSNNFTECLSGVEVNVVKSYEGLLTNVIVNDNKIFLLEKTGTIFDVDDNEVFLDLTEKVKVFEEFAESGLFSLAFHPIESFFLVSYSDAENNLIVEKYYLNSDFKPEIEKSEILRMIPNTQCCHYSGNIIWSNYFKDFLLGIGDMQNKNGILHSDPLDTTSPRGKILFLDKLTSKPDLLAVDKNNNARNDILAFGLRNPWKTTEYKNYLFVPDIGNAQQEELNIVDLNEFNQTKKPYLFGWPHFEGTQYNSLDFNQILLHENDTSKNIKNYIYENTLLPDVYYNHNAPENYRAAIIGGDVIKDINSKYFEHYFFADYLSNELFAYDINKKELKMFPLGNIGGVVTSVGIHPKKNETILITTLSGLLLEIILP